MPPRADNFCDNDTTLTVKVLSGVYSSSRTHRDNEQFMQSHLLSDKEKNANISEKDLNSSILISSSDNGSDIDELVPEFEPHD